MIDCCFLVALIAQISLVYNSETETPDTLITTILAAIKASGSFSRVKSLAMLVPCEPGMAEVLFRT